MKDLLMPLKYCFMTLSGILSEALTANRIFEASFNCLRPSLKMIKSVCCLNILVILRYLLFFPQLIFF